jgi:hypothetical protein
MNNYIRSASLKYWTVMVAITFIIIGLFTWSPIFNVPDLIKIEFAKNPYLFNNYIAAYIHKPSPLLVYNTYLDFAFIAAYTLLFCLSAKVVCDLFESKKNWFLYICLFPGICDTIENFLLLQMIKVSPLDYSNFNLFHTMVRLKWGLAIPGMVLVIIVTAYQIYAFIDKAYLYFSDKAEA